MTSQELHDKRSELQTLWNQISTQSQRRHVFNRQKNPQFWWIMTALLMLCLSSLPALFIASLFSASSLNFLMIFSGFLLLVAGLPLFIAIRLRFQSLSFFEKTPSSIEKQSQTPVNPREPVTLQSILNANRHLQPQRTRRSKRRS